MKYLFKYNNVMYMFVYSSSDMDSWVLNHAGSGLGQQ